MEGKNKILQKIGHSFSLRERKGLFLLFFAAVFALVFFPKTTQAASLFLSPSSGSFGVNKNFSIGVYVSSDEAMNAASSEISFPHNKVEVVSISKSGSIFNLWAQDPSFSNNAGTISFEGIILNPGYSGTAGKILTVNFRTKSAGAVAVVFSTGSILANDGKGTNILDIFGNAQFNINIPTGTPAPTPQISQTPSPSPSPSIKPTSSSVPQITSPSHPDQNGWRNSTDAKFVWELPHGTNAVRILYSENSKDTPQIIYEPAISEKELFNLSDGIHYFHLQLKKGKEWGPIAHYKIQIDSAPPEPFEAKIQGGNETTNPAPILLFDTKDELSGIDYYEIKIGEGNMFLASAQIVHSNPFKMPFQSAGKRNIFVKAVDKAGNYTIAMAEINILPLEAPIITDFPQSLLPESSLLLKGTAIPETKVTIHIEKSDREIRQIETQSDKEGKWSLIDSRPFKKGVYNIWAEVTDSLGAKSSPSVKVSILVNPPTFIRIGRIVIDYLSIIITLAGMITLVIFGAIWSGRSLKKKIRNIKKRVAEAENSLSRVFDALKEEAEDQISKFDSKSGLNEKEQKIVSNLKKALEESEKLLSKKIKNIGNK